MLSGLWRNGRVVEGGSLENCCAARYRGFKTYFLRQICHRPGNLPGLFSLKGRRPSMEREITPGVYRHFKGNEYEVIGVAKHSETEEPWSFTARSWRRARPLGATARHVAQAKSIAISTPTPSSDTDSNGHNRPPLSNIVSRGPAPPKTTKGSSRKARAFSKKGPIP